MPNRRTFLQKLRGYYAEMPGFVQLQLTLLATILITAALASALLRLLAALKN